MAANAVPLRLLAPPISGQCSKYQELWYGESRDEVHPGRERARRTCRELGARVHLSRNLNLPKLFLNVRTMWDDLQVTLTEVETRLIDDPAWAAHAPKK